MCIYIYLYIYIYVFIAYFLVSSRHENFVEKEKSVNFRQFWVKDSRHSEKSFGQKEVYLNPISDHLGLRILVIQKSVIARKRYTLIQSTTIWG